MGFFGKLKEKAKAIKEENKNFGVTMKRMNNHANFYGSVNYEIKGGDFRQMSYINIEDGKGLIYNTSEDDYVFTAAELKGCTFSGKGRNVAVGNQKVPTLRFVLEFKDGKKAHADIIHNKVDIFKSAFGINV